MKGLSLSFINNQLRAGDGPYLAPSYDHILILLRKFMREYQDQEFNEGL